MKIYLGDICDELKAKGTALHFAAPPEVATDIQDTMDRAVHIITLAKNALKEIREEGIIVVNGVNVFDDTAMKADEALLQINSINSLNIT